MKLQVELSLPIDSQTAQKWPFGTMFLLPVPIQFSHIFENRPRKSLIKHAERSMMG